MYAIRSRSMRSSGHPLVVKEMLGQQRRDEAGDEHAEDRLLLLGVGHEQGDPQEPEEAVRAARRVHGHVLNQGRSGERRGLTPPSRTAGLIPAAR